ncbi:response regulator [Caulobacter sp.]|uniref:response regulator transcription factor n=1 Tax=Caulobacter sp. TaxID=78 RepID=UPI001B28D7BB|nr:response regulator [Caulobacter sp.]MBO9544086.1 response regulator [Caulobacter sp.]
MPAVAVAPTIFVVDDDPLILAFLQTALAPQGYSVELFETGERMLGKVQTALPALFVVDVRLPTTDGIELVRTLRSIAACADIPILMLTGEGRLDRIVMAMQAGANGYLMKPFSPEQLNAKIRGLLAG